MPAGSRRTQRRRWRLVGQRALRPGGCAGQIVDVELPARDHCVHKEPQCGFAHSGTRGNIGQVELQVGRIPRRYHENNARAIVRAGRAAAHECIGAGGSLLRERGSGEQKSRQDSQNRYRKDLRHNPTSSAWLQNDRSRRGVYRGSSPRRLVPALGWVTRGVECIAPGAISSGRHPPRGPSYYSKPGSRSSGVHKVFLKFL